MTRGGRDVSRGGRPQVPPDTNAVKVNLASMQVETEADETVIEFDKPPEHDA